MIALSPKSVQFKSISDNDKLMSDGFQEHISDPLFLPGESLNFNLQSY